MVKGDVRMISGLMTSKKLSTTDGTDHFDLNENGDSDSVDQKHERRRRKVLNRYSTIETI